MTTEELDRLERRWKSVDPVWQVRSIEPSPESIEQAASEVLALIAEVRRLRDENAELREEIQRLEDVNRWIEPDRGP